VLEDIKGDKVNLYKGKYNSDYFEKTKNILDILNNVSPSFCLAKWYNVSLHLPTGKTHSCYHPPSHNIPLEELNKNPSALHNTAYKKEQRKLMLKGKRPNECSFCWEIEDQGNISDRAYRSKDVYEPNLIDDILSKGPTDNPNPRYLEVNFNQACNFKCSYCSPHLSTEWHKEVLEHGAYKLIDSKHNDPSWVESLKIDNSPDNPYTLAFWQWFPNIYNDLKTFRMTGGEPLMDKNTFKVFEFIKKHPKADLNLSITSNCCPPGQQWSKFLQSLKYITENNCIDHFMLFCSLDSWGKQAEYIRNGLDFSVLHKNIVDYLKTGKKHSLTFIITANILSLPNWLNFIKEILNLRIELNDDRQLIWFDVPMLHHPLWLSMKLAPSFLLEELSKSINFMEQNPEKNNNRFKGFKDFEVDKIRRLYNWAKEPLNIEQEKIAKQNFYLFFEQHDNRRNTDIFSTFPELKEFIEECKRLI